MFPSNVHRLTNETTEFVHYANERPRARLIGTAGGARSQIAVEDFAYEDDGLFAIALAYGQCDVAALSKQPIDYWAMGGSHQKNTISRTPTIHYPGSPQGRRPAEFGPHGCTLVEVDASREVILSPLVTDVLRWETEEITVDESTDITVLQRKLRDCMQRLIVNSATQHLLVSWSITGSGPLIGALRRGSAASDIVAKLRAEFGSQTPCAWTVTLDTNPPKSFAKSWYDEESMLGEFLRNVRELQTNTAEVMDLESLLGEGPEIDEVAQMVDLSNPDTRADVLRRASALGVQMLSGDEARYG
jgi:DNA repair exonuclease SbcCD nuclease subunit